MLYSFKIHEGAHVKVKPAKVKPVKIKPVKIMLMKVSPVKVNVVKVNILLAVLCSILFSNVVYAQDVQPGEAQQQETEQQAATPQDGVHQNIQNLKNEVIELNRDLFILEEDLLFSANTQVSVFLSMDTDVLFKLDSVQLKLNDKVVSNYLYTEREIKALKRGGVQRLYIGNLTSGEHELTAFFIGRGPSNRNFKRGASKTIEKSGDASYIELKITGESSKEQPDFVVKIWE